MEICLSADFLRVDYISMSLNSIFKNLKETSESSEDEVCGIIYKNKNKFLYKECVNISANPKYEFNIADKDYIETYKKGEIVCIFHSHTVGDTGLSNYDLLNSEYLGVPFLMYENKTKKFHINKIKGFKYLNSLKKALSCVK